MISTTTYKFGDVLLVPCLFVEDNALKKRPAIVVSSDSYNQRHENLILIAVTSQSNAVPCVDSIDIQHWERAGFLLPSFVKPVIKTFPTSTGFKKIGSLLFADKESLRAFLSQVMGLN